MKAMLFACGLTAVATSPLSADPYQDMMDRSPGSTGNLQALHKYPPLPGERPHEADARRSLLVSRDKGIAAGTWTPAMEAQHQQALVQLSAAMSARIAAEKAAEAAAQQRTIIIDRR
jgi:hypothetical protein